MPDLPIPLRHAGDVERAVEHVQGLTGCIEDSAEENELIELVTALDEWLRHNPID
ncbi:hypothetical protein [Bosea sp. BK604]|uniref:hypothetical protein n=1 Tax=Bosea sp. BK604 TaxID=2512180 RepID=UPI0010CEFDC9|nr:hypothetical protein [Bosea sp. BK604]TCR60919.1 hypothetical protein EV560_115144 [Bosea sp. BK604]